MKRLLPVLAICILTKLSFSQTTTIPDTEFERALITFGLDSGQPDGSVPTGNIDTVTVLDISEWYYITDLTGIEDFKLLTSLLSDTTSLDSLNLTQNFEFGVFGL